MSSDSSESRYSGPEIGAGPETPEMTIVLETPHVAMVCATAIGIVTAVLICAGIAWKQFVDEWRADRAAAVVVAQYQLVTAQINVDSFNSSPIPGELQCKPEKKDVVHADLVVQR